jgi:hypothetical protein
MYDRDIIDYLLFPPLRAIPEVEMTFQHISHRLLGILNSYPNAGTVFPPIIAWRLPDRFWAPQRIGWKNLSAEETLLFSWEAGKLKSTQFWELPQGMKPFAPESPPEFQVGFSPLYSWEEGI